MIKLKKLLNEGPQKVGNVNAFGASKVLGKGKKVLGFVPDTPNAVATLIQDYPQAMEIEFKQGFFSDGKLLKSIKKGDKVWKELEKRFLDTATKDTMKAGFKMNEVKLFEDFVNESVVNEGWKDNLIGLLVLGSIVAGFNHLNHSAERNLERGNPVEISVRHSLFSDRPMARDNYTIKVNPSQKEYVKVDDSTKTITINTSDISNMGLKRAVRDKIKDINPNSGITRNIKNIRIY